LLNLGGETEKTVAPAAVDLNSKTFIDTSFPRSKPFCLPCTYESAMTQSEERENLIACRFNPSFTLLKSK